MRQKLVESVLIVIQTGHGHQETLNDLPGLSPVVGLCVGTLQAVQSCLYGLGGNTQYKSSFKIFTILHSEMTMLQKCQYS